MENLLGRELKKIQENSAKASVIFVAYALFFSHMPQTRMHRITNFFPKKQTKNKWKGYTIDKYIHQEWIQECQMHKSIWIKAV